MEKFIIKRKRWKKGYFYVAYGEDKKILAYKRVKGSGINKAQATNIFQYRGTFDINRVVQRTKLVNVRETSIYETSGFKDGKFLNKAKKIRRGSNYAYIVRGWLDNREVVVSSGTDGTDKEKIARARKNFIAKLGEKFVDGNISYDEDEGLKQIENVSYIKEGWVYYDKIKATN